MNTLHKTALVFSIITVLLIGAFSYPVPNAEAEEEAKPKPKLLPSVKKIKLVQYIGGVSSDDLPFATFSITNFAQVPTENLKIFATELVNKDEIRFVGNTDYHIFNNFNVSYNKNTIEPDQPLHVNYFLYDPIPDEGTYEGQIQITGDNFDTITIDVEIEAKHNPWYLLYTTLAGIASAFLLGLVITYREKKKNFTDAFADDPKIADHVNKHITEWNKLRSSIETNSWKILSQLFQGKKNDIENRLEAWDLDKDKESVKWFETIGLSLFEKSLDGKKVVGNQKLNPISYKKREPSEITKKVKEGVWKELLTVNKGLYLLATVIVSIPTAVFVADNFIGLDFINYIIAYGIGFAVFKVQDIRDTFFKK